MNLLISQYHEDVRAADMRDPQATPWKSIFRVIKAHRKKAAPEFRSGFSLICYVYNG